MTKNREWVVKLNETHVISMRAAIRTSCRCGHWVHPGDFIRWDTKLKKTVGCPLCKSGLAEHPDEHVDIDEWADAFPVFHEDI